jgi:peptidoglycan/LPS O-acetylase OafA/YrhL
MTEHLPRSRNFGLDIARAAAITGVFLVHGFTFNGIPLLGDLRTGVDLFFVLSGFLIGRIYFRSHAAGNFALWPFWISRWWRTLPPYFVALGLHALLGHWISELHVPWYYIFFLQNEIGMHGFPTSWSLCVEEHFYLLLPLIAGCVLSVLPRRALTWLLPVLFFVPLLLLYVSTVQPGWLLWHTQVPPGFMTQYVCEGLIGGVWLAYLYVERPQLWLRLQAYARFLWILIPIMLFLNPIYPIGITGGTLYAIGYVSSVRMRYDLRWEPAKPLSRQVKRAITGLAMAAYSIYLCHYFTFQILRSHVLRGLPRGVEKSSITLIGGFCFCILFYFLVERPSITSRDWYIARHRRLIPSTAVPDEEASLRTQR